MSPTQPKTFSGTIFTEALGFAAPQSTVIESVPCPLARTPPSTDHTKDTIVESSVI